MGGSVGPEFSIKKSLVGPIGQILLYFLFNWYDNLKYFLVCGGLCFVINLSRTKTEGFEMLRVILLATEKCHSNVRTVSTRGSGVRRIFQ